MKLYNRIKKRWPRAIRSRVHLAKLDFNFVVACDRVFTQAGESTPGRLLQVGREASIELEKCKIPPSQWEVPHASN